MNPLLFTPLAFLGMLHFSSTTLEAQGEQQISTVVVGHDLFRVTGYEIFMKDATEWKPVATFALPTVATLLMYRPRIRDDFGFDEHRMTFFDVVQNVASVAKAVYGETSKVWAGFDFYEGEGWEGYGGVGFYDRNKKQIGVLRHPALVDYSVESFIVTDTIIYIKTVGNYELSASIGNGLVILNRKSGLATAIVPPGTSTLWDKDDPANCSALYNRPIPEILADHHFLPKPMPQYSSAVLQHIQQVGLDSFMVETEQTERAIRDSLTVHAVSIIDTVLILTQEKPDASLSYGFDLGMPFHLEPEAAALFSIEDRGYSFSLNTGANGIDAKKDTLVQQENIKYRFSVRLVDFTPRKLRSGFESITVQATVKEIR
jgi:hypothetical protein